MKFHLIALAALGAVSTSSAYVIKIFSEVNCGGEEYRRNVWDNTCADGFPFLGKSAMAIKYGSKHQRVRFHEEGNCSLGRFDDNAKVISNVSFGPKYADVPDGDWEVGRCINVAVAAAGSFRV